jgi:hypothetical protein
LYGEVRSSPYLYPCCRVAVLPWYGVLVQVQVDNRTTHRTTVQLQYTMDLRSTPYFDSSPSRSQGTTAFRCRLLPTLLRNLYSVLCTPCSASRTRLFLYGPTAQIQHSARFCSEREHRYGVLTLWTIMSAGTCTPYVVSRPWPGVRCPLSDARCPMDVVPLCIAQRTSDPAGSEHAI